MRPDVPPDASVHEAALDAGAEAAEEISFVPDAARSDMGPSMAPPYGMPPEIGPRSASGIESVIRAARPRLRACGDVVDGGVSAAIDYTVRISPSGSVTSAIPGSSSIDPKVVACATAVLRSLRFPPSDDVSEIVVPVILVKSE